jgi:hypothetical protein
MGLLHLTCLLVGFSLFDETLTDTEIRAVVFTCESNCAAFRLKKIVNIIEGTGVDTYCSEMRGNLPVAPRFVKVAYPNGFNPAR